jgi:hypothetical protein
MLSISPPRSESGSSFALGTQMQVCAASFVSGGWGYGRCRGAGRRGVRLAASGEVECGPELLHGPVRLLRTAELKQAPTGRFSSCRDLGRRAPAHPGRLPFRTTPFTGARAPGPEARGRARFSGCGGDLGRGRGRPPVRRAVPASARTVPSPA